MTNPSDQHIASLIEELCTQAARFTTSDDDRQTYINQIAQLRSSMNPVIIQKIKKD